MIVCKEIKKNLSFIPFFFNPFTPGGTCAKPSKIHIFQKNKSKLLPELILKIKDRIFHIHEKSLENFPP